MTKGKVVLIEDSFRYAARITYKSETLCSNGDCIEGAANFFEQDKPGTVYPVIWVQTPDGLRKKPYCRWADAMAYSRKKMMEIFMRDIKGDIHERH